MKCFRTTVCVNLLLLVLCLGSWCNGDDETMAAPMEKTEQESLYSAIQGFVGKDWNGSDLYPDPCGWTPIQVLFFFLPLHFLLQTSHFLGHSLYLENLLFIS